MQLPELSIKRPVLAIVISLLVVLVGLIAFGQLSVREYPNIDRPVITVETRYTGANAQIIESQLTQPLEDSLSGIEGIDFMTSVSRSELSQITITFKLDREADAAASDVRDRVGRVRGQLPDDIDDPIVAKVEADAQPIIWLAFSSDRHDPMKVSDVADRQVKDQLQTASGVANVLIFGERRYSMRIWLSRTQMAAHNITVEEIEQALEQQNLEIPAGRIESVEREFSILSETDLRTPEQFAAIILRNQNGYSVRLGDVARVEIGPQSTRKISRFKGQSAVALGVVKQSTANPLEVSAAIRERMAEIQPNLPEGMKVDIAYDSSVFIDRSIEAVYNTLAQASVLVVLVIFLFLRNLRATLIPMLTIPVSLVGAFALMLWWGFSINTLTLLALVLAIGLVVDDAIVMLENIYRHIEQGLSPIQAAFKGSREISFAVIATTVTLVAVFIPVVFSSGQTGMLFTEFALTVAAAVIVSSLVALTLSPMMSSRLLRQPANQRIDRFDRQMQKLTNGYRSLLKRLLKHAWLMLLVIAGSGYGSWLLYQQLPHELAPIEDRGTVIGFSIAPDGASVNFMDRYARQMEQIFSQVEDSDRYFMVVGFPAQTNAIAFVGLKPWEQRQQSQQQIADQLMPQLYGGVVGTMSFAMQPTSLGQEFLSRPVKIVLQSSTSYQQLQQLLDQLMPQVYASGLFAQPDNNLKLNKPELRIQMDRDKIADVGSQVSSIGHTLETLMAGRNMTRFKLNGEQYDVIVQIDDAERTNPSDLTDIYVRGRDQQLVQLANLLDISEQVAPRELHHFNKLKSVTLEASLMPGVSLDKALAFLEQAITDSGIDVQVDYAGESREFMNSSSSLETTFVLALAFIFLVLAAQFDSFRAPLVILVSVPTATFGALLALQSSGSTINVYSQIGLITLVGLIAKHGILIVEFANQLQERGMERLEALVEAASLRLRPILMTTSATVLGVLPLALAEGAGAESRHQIGWVIIGGMLFGTLLSLLVVPAIYALFRTRPAIHVEPARS